MRAELPNYDTDPRLPQPPGTKVFVGSEVWGELAAAAGERAVVVVDCYPGVDEEAVQAALESRFEQVINVPDAAAKPIEEIDALIARNLGDDRVFGYMTQYNMIDFYDEASLEELRRRVADREGPIVLVGWGAALAAPDADLLVLADMPRWEIQLRMRAGMPNWRCNNHDEDILRKYKRGFFVEWRIADRHKKQIRLHRLLPRHHFRRTEAHHGRYFPLCTRRGSQAPAPCRAVLRPGGLGGTLDAGSVGSGRGRTQLRLGLRLRA